MDGDTDSPNNHTDDYEDEMTENNNNNNNHDDDDNNHSNNNNEIDKLSRSHGNLQNALNVRPESSNPHSHATTSRARTWGHGGGRHGRHSSSKDKNNKTNKKEIPRQPRIDDCIRTRYPSWQMTARNDKDIYHSNARSPGPVYVPKVGYVLPEAPRFSITGVTDDQTVEKRSPGPIYNPKYNFTSDVSPSFSLLPRREVVTFSTQTPAPNQYDPTKSKWFRSQKKFALKGRIETKESVVSSTPGPTDYDVSKSIRKHSLIGCKIGKRLPDMTQNYLKTVPGPAAYMPTTDYTLPRTKKFTIGTRTKILDSKDDNPGPGHYGPSIIPPLIKKKKRKNAPRF